MTVCMVSSEKIGTLAFHLLGSLIESDTDSLATYDFLLVIHTWCFIVTGCLRLFS